MPSAVLDASLALRWVLPDEYSESADQARGEWERGDVDLLVPPVFWAEVANGLIKAVRQGRLDIDEADEAIAWLDNSGLTLVPTYPDIHRTALRLAHQYQRSVHDLIYVAVSQRRGVPFWHADTKLNSALVQQAKDAPPAQLRYFE